MQLFNSFFSRSRLMEVSYTRTYGNMSIVRTWSWLSRECYCVTAWREVTEHCPRPEHSGWGILVATLDVWLVLDSIKVFTVILRAESWELRKNDESWGHSFVLRSSSWCSFKAAHIWFYLIHLVPAGFIYMVALLSTTPEAEHASQHKSRDMKLALFPPH